MEAVLSDPRELVARAKRGDEQAFAVLYNTYYVAIFRYIFFRVRNRHEAEDLAQTVFMKIYRSIKDFQERTSPLGYFYTIARNTVIDYWRKKKEIALEDAEEFFLNIPSSERNPRELAEKNEMAEEVRATITQLTREQRDVITLKFLSGLSNREISKALRKTEEAVRQLQFRALKGLRKHYRNSPLSMA